MSSCRVMLACSPHCLPCAWVAFCPDIAGVASPLLALPAAAHGHGVRSIAIHASVPATPPRALSQCADLSVLTSVENTADIQKLIAGECTWQAPTSMHLRTSGPPAPTRSPTHTHHLPTAADIGLLPGGVPADRTIFLPSDEGVAKLLAEIPFPVRHQHASITHGVAAAGAGYRVCWQLGCRAGGSGMPGGPRGADEIEGLWRGVEGQQEPTAAPSTPPCGHSPACRASLSTTCWRR